MKRAEVLFVLDLDRTMANTRLYDVAEDILQELLGGGYELLRQTRQRTEASGGSFDFIEYLDTNALPSGEFLVRFAKRAREYGESAFRNDGAARLLHELTDHEVPFIFMTYGGEMWQRAKLAATGYDKFPYIVTSTKEKGSLIARWYDGVGRFEIPIRDETMSAGYIVLVDDKFAAFTGLPSGDNAHGYWLRPDKEKALRAEEAGSNIKVIHALSEIDTSLYS